MTRARGRSRGLRSTRCATGNPLRSVATTSASPPSTPATNAFNTGRARLKHSASCAVGLGSSRGASAGSAPSPRAGGSALSSGLRDTAQQPRPDAYESLRKTSPTGLLRPMYGRSADDGNTCTVSDPSGATLLFRTGPPPTVTVEPSPAVTVVRRRNLALLHPRGRSIHR